MTALRFSRKRGGFSLLELLITLAVIGILVGLGFPLLNNFLAQRRLDEAAVTLSNTLRRASDQAITQSQDVTMTVTADTLRWAGEDNSVLGERKLPNGAQLSPTATVRFSGRGLPETSYTFDVSTSSRTKKVYLLPTGAVIIK